MYLSYKSKYRNPQFTRVEHLKYRDFCAQSPSFLKTYLIQMIDSENSNKPGAFMRYLNKIAMPVTSNPRQQFLNCIQQWSHNDLCVFLVKENITINSKEKQHLNNKGQLTNSALTTQMFKSTENLKTNITNARHAFFRNTLSTDETDHDNFYQRPLDIVSVSLDIASDKQSHFCKNKDEMTRVVRDGSGDDGVALPGKVAHEEGDDVTLPEKVAHGLGDEVALPEKVAHDRGDDVTLPGKVAHGQGDDVTLPEKVAHGQGDDVTLPEKVVGDIDGAGDDEAVLATINELIVNNSAHSRAVGLNTTEYDLKMTIGTAPSSFAPEHCNYLGSSICVVDGVADGVVDGVADGVADGVGAVDDEVVGAIDDEAVGWNVPDISENQECFTAKSTTTQDIPQSSSVSTCALM